MLKLKLRASLSVAGAEAPQRRFTMVSFAYCFLAVLAVIVLLKLLEVAPFG